MELIILYIFYLFNTLRVFLKTKKPRSDGFIFTSVQNNEKQHRGWNLVLNPDISTKICKVTDVFKRNFKVLERKENWLSAFTLTENPTVPLSIDYSNNTIDWFQSR